MKKVLNKGFTLIEVLVVIVIIAILAAIVLVAVNPGKRFLDARESQRKANVQSIVNAIQQNMVDNKGITTCTIPETAGLIKAPIPPVSSSDVDISACLAPYLLVLPVDPSDGVWISASNYNTKYTISMKSVTKQVTVSAQSEVDQNADGDVDVSDKISFTR